MSIFWDTLMGCWGKPPVISQPPPTASVSISLNQNAYCNKGVQYSTDTLSVFYNIIGGPGSTGYRAALYINGSFNRNLSLSGSGLTLTLLRIDIVAATGNVVGSYYSNTVSYNSGTCQPL